jgi:hypothetical protein
VSGEILWCFGFGNLFSWVEFDMHLELVGIVLNISWCDPASVGGWL